MKRKLLILLVFLFGASSSLLAEGTRYDVENKFKYRFGAEVEIKIIKGLKLEIAPEFRFNSGFERINLGGGLSYKTLGCIYLGASYRFDFYREDAGTTNSFSNNTEYNWQTFHRYAFDLTYKDRFKRFTPSFRLRYSNYSDDDDADKQFLRYRAKVNYDIKKCKITPFAYVEAYQQLDDGLFYKMRYGAGFDVKATKRSSFGFEYKLDFFMLKYTNAHIFSATYKLSF